MERKAVNVFLNINEKKDADFKIAAMVIYELKKANFVVFTDCLKLVGDFVSEINDSVLKKIDLAIVLGGDGTILNFKRQYSEYDIPIFAINLGRVGALAQAELSNFKSYITKIKKHEYVITDYLALDGKIIKSNGEISFIAYNDIYIHRGSSPKILDLSVKINEGIKDNLRADGVVIATPAGSSAYNLSAGGPLLLPNTASFVLTPICAQFKLFSPIVIDKDNTLSFVINNAKDTSLFVDGAIEYKINSNDIIKISGSKKYLKLISFKDENDLFGSFFKIAKTIYGR